MTNRVEFIKELLGKIDLENLTEEEEKFLVGILAKELEKEEKKVQAKAEKLAKNEKILKVMEEILDKQGQFTSSEIFEAMDGEFTIQRISYVARELAPVVAVNNPLYAVKVYKRA